MNGPELSWLNGKPDPLSKIAQALEMSPVEVSVGSIQGDERRRTANEAFSGRKRGQHDFRIVRLAP
jgi:hypothetical protein